MALSRLDLSAEVRTVIDRMAETQIGDIVSYAALSEAIGANILEQRWIMLRALRELERDSGAIFSNVRKVGYLRHAAEYAPMLGVRARHGIRGKTKRTTRHIESVLQHANDMPDGAQRAAQQEIAALELIRYLATDRIRKLVPQAEKPQPVAIVLRQIVGRLNGEPED